MSVSVNTLLFRHYNMFWDIKVYSLAIISRANKTNIVMFALYK